MSANLENLAVATGLEKISFHRNHKERLPRMFKLPHNCTHLICWQSKAQNFPSQASTVHELRTYKCSRWFQKRQRSQIKPPISIGSQEKQENSRKTSTSASLTTLNPLTVWITKKLWKILQVMGIPDHLTCLLRNVYAGQETAVRNGHGTTEWFQIRKGVH